MYLIHYVGVSIPIYYILLINMVTPTPRCAAPVRTTIVNWLHNGDPSVMVAERFKLYSLNQSSNLSK